MKNRVLKWLFKGYAKELKDQSELREEAEKQAFDIKDLVRERLKGIRPNHPEDNTVLQNHLYGLDDGTRLVFLSKARDALRNETLRVVIKSLIIESEHKAVLDAPTMVEVNFNRATINGAMLIEEELESLDAMYKEESERNKKLSEEDRFAPL